MKRDCWIIYSNGVSNVIWFFFVVNFFFNYYDVYFDILRDFFKEKINYEFLIRIKYKFYMRY